jgi:hypothetical protein
MLAEIFTLRVGAAARVAKEAAATSSSGFVTLLAGKA